MSIHALAKEDAMALQFRQREITERFAEALDGGEVGIAAFLESLNHLWVLLEGFADFVKFGANQRSMHIFAFLPGFEFVSGDVHESLDGNALVQQDDFGFARNGIAGFPRKNLIFGRLA